MDCGPASLKCLLEGFGIRVSYGRLREACQTDVDGTSIDTLEEVAVQLGLDAEQVILPTDHVLLPASEALPAIAVVRLPNGLTHFVVVWRRFGPFVELMDPATGRRWPTRETFLRELYLHRMHVPAEAWREWAASDEFRRCLWARLKSLGVGRRAFNGLWARASADATWRSFAALDASARLAAALVRSGGIPPGRATARVIDRFAARAAADPKEVPAAYWTAGAAPKGSESPKGEEQLLVSGAVLVRVGGRRAPAAAAEGAPAPLSPELAAALREPRSRPGRDLLRLLFADGFFTPAILLFALAVAAGGVLLEALLFRGLFDIGRDLTLPEQRLGAMAGLIIFSAALLFVELPLVSGVLRLGRRLETRLRTAFLEKIPRLGDRYFQSRLTSDMAERSHGIHVVRQLPLLASNVLRSLFGLLFTAVGIAWLDPESAWLAGTAAGMALLLPILIQKPLVERDLRLRSHTGALARFYLDALLGLTAIRTHGAERSVRREHESLLVEWARAGRSVQRTAIWVDGLLSLTGFALCAWLVASHLGRSTDGGAVLLLVYWALNLPVLGQDVALALRQYPLQRNSTLRLLEPLGAPEESVPMAPAGPPVSSGAAALHFESVTVRAAGHTLLQDVTLSLPAKSHVAVVGPSGAGKTTFLGLLLGWHRAAEGRILLDGEPADAARLGALRRQTAWVDPAIQLWNRPLLSNLLYGADGTLARPLAQVIDSAELRGVLEKMPEGLQTALGESGALVSGGEGQRVRLGRAMLRPDVRLVLLDEPFRGLDREARRELLRRARELWKDATLLCVTHDVGETLGFERVLVVENGRIAEDGAPAELHAREGSRYRALLDAEADVRSGMWSSADWRRLWLQEGRLRESAP
jgi:ATP-binding cassette subfamily B protein